MIEFNDIFNLARFYNELEEHKYLVEKLKLPVECYNKVTRGTTWEKDNDIDDIITNEVKNIWNNLDPHIKDIWNTNATIKSNQKKK